MIILNLDTKKCMSSLLLKDSFHHFFFIKGEITTFGTFTMDGYLHQEFFEESPARKYALWQDCQGYCLSLIKGRRTPLHFRFILSLSDSGTARLLSRQQLDFRPEQVQGLFLNFLFDGTRLTCTTGVSVSVFTLDKALDHAWDSWVRSFFAGLEIPFEEE